MLKPLRVAALCCALVAAGFAQAAQPAIDQPTVGPHSMTDFVTNYLNPTLEGAAGCWSGSTAPVNGPGSAAIAYQCWFDTSTSPSTLRYRIGSQWTASGTYDSSGNYIPAAAAGSIPTSALNGTFSGPVAATTLSASGAVSGAGFTNYMASPPAIGGTTPNAIASTGFTATGSTGGINVIDRTTTGYGAFYRTAGVNYLYDSTGGNIFLYNGYGGQINGTFNVTGGISSNGTLVIDSSQNWRGAPITNSNLAQAGAATLKGNPTASTANDQDFTVQGLTDITTPNSTLDFIPIYNHTTGTIEKATPAEIAAVNTSGVSSLNSLTGALSITAGSNISVTPSGSSIAIAYAPATQSANTIYAGPPTGSPAVNTNRAMVCADLPSGGRCLLNTLTASASATLSDTTSLTSKYDQYEIVFENIIPATSATSCELQVHLAGGTFQTTGYISAISYANSSGASYGGSTTYIPCSVITGALNSAPGVNARIFVASPSSTTAVKAFYGQGSNIFSSSLIEVFTTTGVYATANTAIDGFQVSFPSTTITSGQIKIYAIVN